MGMSHAAPTSRTLPAVPGAHSAEALYIRNQVEPRIETRNVWNKGEIFGPAKLLWRSTRPHKVTARKINDTNLLFHQAGLLVGTFDRSVTSLVSHQARRACSSRYTLRSYLKASGLSVPEGKVFRVAQAVNASEYQRQLSAPVTVRPASVKAATGISTGISTEGAFAVAWQEAVKACASLPALQRQILVERHHPGLDLRLYVVGEDVSAALVRLPYYAVGDGTSTVGELHSRVAEGLNNDPYLLTPSAVQMEEFLAPLGIEASDVPGLGEVVPLSATASAAPGRAITVDVTQSVHRELKHLAADAMWAFPGLSAAGVDLRVRGVEDPEGAVIIGVDPAADISEFRYPTYGQYRRVSMDIIGHMVRQASR